MKLWDVKGIFLRSRSAARTRQMGSAASRNQLISTTQLKEELIMPSMYVQNITIPIANATPNSSGVITAQTTYSFPTNIISAAASVATYTLSFGHKDHHVKTVGASVQVQTQVNSPTVTVSGSLQLIDDSNNKLDTANCQLVAAIVAWGQ
jgi:hypothetical protein